MPPTSKPAPPQQSSLNELWKKGGRKKAEPDVSAESAASAAAMDMDVDVPPVASTSKSPKTPSQPGNYAPVASSTILAHTKYL